MKSFLQNDNRNVLKNKIYKYDVNFKKYDLVNKYNNTYHSTIKMKPIDVT